MASDCIEVTGLRVECIIGVDGWERRLTQQVLLDVALYGDFSSAGTTDDLRHTVDYRGLSRSIVDAVSATRHRLLESLAEDVARVCLDSHELVERVCVRVHKPGALAGFGGAKVAFQIERPRISG